ncbi:hypothetical protein [Mixta mediterraneensis]|uniref:hypothetical protein n=1 Tax=Mixta mediterraneensis TaxID=2758443 RepID=UPI001EEE2D01|nr:hypothetical protein [Mixta mediterraneensis]MBE5254590.1 hypothetical protein [Mixta mediterraneensis]
MKALRRQVKAQGWGQRPKLWQMPPNNGKFMRRAATGASWISVHRLMTHYRERRIMARFDGTFGPQALPMDDLALSLEYV